LTYYSRKAIRIARVISEFKVSREVLEEALHMLKSRFHGKSSSWFNRCLDRLTDVKKAVKANTWIVRGRPELGDYEPLYIVTYTPEIRRYTCTCYDPRKPYGSHRMKSICTHVGAVILWRLLMERRLHEFAAYGDCKGHSEAEQ